MMADPILAARDAAEQRRIERRRFLKVAGGGAATAGALSLLAACGSDNSPSPTPSATPTPTPTPTASPTAAFSQTDALAYVLNLEYLQAQFFLRAATGAGLPAALLTGSGTQGEVTGGRAATLSDTVRLYAREMASDDAAHVAYLRGQLGGSVVAQPAINIDGGASGAFTAAMRAAGVVGSTATFDPYESDANFLLAAFFLKDVVVTAYRGIVTALTTLSVREAGVGIHTAEAYHAGLIRTVLYVRGAATADLRTNAANISNTRDQLDGSLTDLDQPVTGTTDTSNIVPADTDGVTFIRTPEQVLNIFYLTRAAVTAGGFFPAGVNGTLRTSGANTG